MSLDDYVHFYGGAPLNRFSWLRESSEFLEIAAEKVTTRWIVFRSGEPLMDTSVSTERPGLAYFDTPTVSSLLGPKPLFGQGANPGENAPSDLDAERSKSLQAARLHGSPIVFLGVQEPESETARSASEFRNPEKAEDIHGNPMFALDITSAPLDLVNNLLEKAVESGRKLTFVEPRSAATGFNHFDASVFSLGRSMIDWIVRNKFCPGCGSRVYTLWGGWKLACTTLLPWTSHAGDPCPSGKGLQNFQHPRTDSVVITAIIDENDGNRILLGRNKKFPGKFYSTLAGFIEPSESIEDAVRREAWEESGIRVDKVQYHSCQPWPYPVNLMIGCYASANGSQTARVDLDNELQDARWFTRQEVLEVLAHPYGTKIRRRDLSNFDRKDKDIIAAAPTSDTKPSDPPFQVPPKTAIAGVLISLWANREIDLTSLGNSGSRARI
jgi:NAD+ diphosphatase